MAEKKILVEEQKLSYEGLFNLKDLFLEIDQFLRERGYDRYEKHNQEQVTEEGKEVVITLEPFKTYSDYAKAEMEIDMHFHDLKEVEIEHDGIRETLLKGKADFKFQVRLITDYENRWSQNAVQTFIRTLVDKFVHKTQTNQFEDECTQDCDDLREEIKAFLNLFRYKA